jgi:hypothetical protein
MRGVTICTGPASYSKTEAGASNSPPGSGCDWGVAARLLSSERGSIPLRAADSAIDHRASRTHPRKGFPIRMPRPSSARRRG